MARPQHDERERFLDKSGNIDRIFYGLVVVCAALLIADLLYHKHTHFTFEGWFGFYAIFGFVAFVFAVFAGAQLRRLIKRDEDYYDR